MRGADGRAGSSAFRKAAAVSIWPTWRRSSVDARVERGVRALGGLGRQGAGHQGRLETISSASNRAARALAVGELGAVQQRQTLLGTQHQRRQAGVLASAWAAGRTLDTVDEDLADPDHAGGHVGQRRQVARSSDRALAGDHRVSGSGRAWLLQQPAPSAARTRLMRPGPGWPASGPSSGGSREPATARPTPAAWDRTMLRWSVSRSASPMRTASQFSKAGIDPVHRLAPGQDALRRPRALSSITGQAVVMPVSRRRAAIDRFFHSASGSTSPGCRTTIGHMTSSRRGHGAG